MRRPCAAHVSELRLAQYWRHPPRRKNDATTLQVRLDLCCKRVSCGAAQVRAWRILDFAIRTLGLLARRAQRSELRLLRRLGNDFLQSPQQEDLALLLGHVRLRRLVKWEMQPRAQAPGKGLNTQHEHKGVPRKYSSVMSKSLTLHCRAQTYFRIGNGGDWRASCRSRASGSSALQS